MNEIDPARVVTSAMTPIAIMSVCALLNLAFCNRLAAVVARMRAFQRERLDHFWRQNNPPSPPRRLNLPHQLGDLECQTRVIRRRARLLRVTILCLLGGMILLAICSAGLGLGDYWAVARMIAAGTFLLAIVMIIVGLVSAALEIWTCLVPMEQEADLVDTLTQGNPSSDAHSADVEDRVFTAAAG